MLLLQAGQVVPLDRMVELVWGAQPPAGVHNAVQTHVSRLRKALAPDRELSIAARRPGYVLHVDPHRVDLHRFRRLVTQARTADNLDRSGELFREALDQWHGRPLADVATTDSLQRLCAGLEEERLAALQERFAVDLRLGRHAAVLGELAELVADYPLREGLAEKWILALYRCGRQADALAELQRIRTRLVDGLGIEPGPALRSLQQRILRADPTLDPPAPPAAASRVSRSVPAQLPADIAGFCGRTNELADLSTLLPDMAGGGATAVAIAAIAGTAGVGKTALAIHFGHRVRDLFPDGQLYLDLRGYDPDQAIPPGDALTRFLEALGVAGPDIPIDLDERASRYRTAIADRRMLIVLDNASFDEQVRTLLPGTPSCMVIVTSRDSLAGVVARHGARRLELDLLPIDDATSLLHRLIGERVETDPTAAGVLAEQCARLPLALRVAAELAVSKPTAPLAELVRELADRPRRLRLLDAGGDVRSAVRAVFSWTHRHLPSDAARLFHRLGWHPGPDFDLHAVAALGHLDLDGAGRLLDILVRAHLVHPGAHGRFGMHDLLRAYALELAGANDSDAARTAALTRLFDHYLAATVTAMEVLYPVGRSPQPRVPAPDMPVPPMADPAELRAWLDVERPNLVAVCAYAATHGWPTHTIRLAATLYRYLEGGHYTDALAIHGHALRAARESGDQSGEAHALTNLGLVYRLLGLYGPATDHLSQALDLHRRTGDQYGEARTQSNLGIVGDRLGEHASAADHLRQALTLYQELDDRHGTAAVLTNLGCVDIRPGHYPRAAENLTAALALFRELGDPGGEASALVNLGDAEMQMGRYAPAAEHLEEALALFRDMNHRYGQAAALSNLGPVYTRLGRHEQAIAHLHEALALFRDTGHPYGEANTLNALGEALHAAGRPGAHAQHTAALATATETGDRDEQARAHTGIAHAHQSTGDLDRAREQWQHALTLLTDENSPEAERIRAHLAAIDPTTAR